MKVQISALCNSEANNLFLQSNLSTPLFPFSISQFYQLHFLLFLYPNTPNLETRLYFHLVFQYPHKYQRSPFLASEFPSRNQKGRGLQLPIKIADGLNGCVVKLQNSAARLSDLAFQESCHRVFLTAVLVFESLRVCCICLNLIRRCKGIQGC
ncbi:hypothetical protein Hanom_Chr15g01363151 [Helianthus anomalus]